MTIKLAQRATPLPNSPPQGGRGQAELGGGSECTPAAVALDLHSQISPLAGEVAAFPGTRAPSASARRWALIGVKALVSIGLVALVASRLDYARLLSYWHMLDGAWIVGVLAIFLLQMCLIAGLRLKLMLGSVGEPRPLRTTAQIALCGFFFEQVTIGFIGGDAVRLWLLRATDMPLGRAVQGLLLDRACGFASLVLLSLLGVHALLPVLPQSVRHAIVITLAAFIAAGCLGIALLVLLSKVLPPTKVAAYWRRLGLSEYPISIPVVLIVLTLAVATQLLNVLAFWMLGQSLGLPTTMYQWLVVAPTVLLVSMLPISIGGWGVREGAMVVALHGFAIAPEDALLPSVLFGLCAIAATLPGAMLWAINKDAGAGKPR